jgi:hypothetical protein
LAAISDPRRRLDDIERAGLARRWSALRSENAAFRVVSPAAQLVSAPIDHFDNALLDQVSSEPKPMTVGSLKLWQARGARQAAAVPTLAAEMVD